MQVVDSEIHIGPEGVLAEFLGEGGEKKAVTVSVPDPRLAQFRTENRWALFLELPQRRSLCGRPWH